MNEVELKKGADQIISLAEQIDGLMASVTAGYRLGLGLQVYIDWDGEEGGMRTLFSLDHPEADKRVVDAITKLSGIIAARQ